MSPKHEICGEKADWIVYNESDGCATIPLCSCGAHLPIMIDDSVHALEATWQGHDFICDCVVPAATPKTKCALSGCWRHIPPEGEQG